MRFLVRVCLAAVVVCINGCTCSCSADDEIVARVDSPVPAEWIHTTHWYSAGGRGALIPFRRVHESFVVIQSTPPSKFGVGCYEPEPELVSDATGARFAYRCDDDKPWGMAFAGSGGRAIAAWPTGLGAGTTPNWAGAVSFEQAALDMVKGGDVPTPLFEEARARGGDHAVAVLLVPFADAYKPDSLKRWEEQYRGLSADEQSFVLAQLAARFAKPEPNLEAALLFAGWSPAEEPALALLRTFAKRLLDGDHSGDVTRSAGVLCALRNAGSHPEEAGQLACRAFEQWIGTFTEDARSPSHTTADEKRVLLTLARTGVRCKAVEEKLGMATRDNLMDCSREGERFRACNREDLEAKVREDWEALEREAGVHRSTSLNLGELRLALRYVAGPLPEDLAMVVRRSNYDIVEPATPSCDAPDSPADAPCECFGSSYLIKDALFEVDPRPDAEGDFFRCRFRIDDVGRKIIVLGKPRAAAPASSAAPEGERSRADASP